MADRGTPSPPQDPDRDPPLPAEPPLPVADLGAFGAPVTAVVVGASGGIGGALTRLLASHPAVAAVHGLARDPARVPAAAGDARAPIHPAALDYDRPETIAAAFTALAAGGAPTLVIVATGLLHDPARGLMPEKTWRHLEAGALARLFAVNAIGPLLVARAALTVMPRDRRCTFAALTARVGSISDNRLGGWYGYRAAKAALVMGLRTLAIEQARRAPQMTVLGLHPGTVVTDLSAPFGGGPAERLTPRASAAALLEVIARRGPEHSGQVFDWRDQPVPP